jgi:hypothetical protein
MYAPVEDPPASELALAQLTINAEGYALIDLRPVPAALAIDDELARIGAAATALAESLGNDPAVKLVAEIARLTAYPRVQPQLLLRLEQLVVAQHSKLYLSPPCRAWLDRLARAVNDVTPGDDASGGSAPTRRQIAAIGFAIGGLAYVSEVKKP